MAFGSFLGYGGGMDRGDFWAGLAALTLLCGCSDKGEIPGFNELSEQVEGSRIGQDTDQWIEMLNVVGEWERTGLIFGYGNDLEECEKAIAGLKAANYAREYRCSPAN